MDVLLKERPLSLRTLCCISVVLHSRDKTLLPKEIRDSQRSRKLEETESFGLH